MAYAVIQNLFFYYLFIKSFGFHMPRQLPFHFPTPPPPPPIALLAAQQELLKIYVSICIIYAIFTYFSN